MESDSCRICLNNERTKLSSLFSCDNGESYAELVTFSCGIEIDQSDSLPKMICFDCIHHITSACSIKQLCLKTEQFLKQTINHQTKSSEPNDKIMLHENPIEISLTSVEIEKFLEEGASSTEKTESNYSVRCKKKQKTSKGTARNKNKKPEEDDYRCFICDKVFDLISAKDSHVKQEHKDVKFCTVCKKRKQTAISLENHLRYHKFGYRFLCSSCGRSFRFKNLLENHLKVEHFNTVKFSCDCCPYETKFKINVERHIKSVHLKLKNFRCQYCGDHEYSTQVGLNLHLYRLHGVPAPVSCPDCMQGFTFESELRVHKKHCTGNTVRLTKARPKDAPVDVLENGFRCRICLKIYETRSKWSVHFHHKHKNSNVCKICNKKMASSTSLFKHIQVQHNNIKKFQCDYPNCQKLFGFKHSLESHKNTHTGEKPYQCDFLQCNFRSGDRSTISKHKKKMHSQGQMFEENQIAQ